MEVQQLRHLLAAVQYGNLVKAAEECYISQSGLSRSIKSLETRLGVPLLIRSANGVEPTVYGLSILDRARVILNEVQRSVHEINEVKSGRSGHVTLGLTHNFAHRLMPPIISEFASGKWNIRVNATVASFPTLVDMVKTGEIDVAFGLLAAIENANGLEIEEVCDSHARIVARVDHPLVGAVDVSPAKLASAKWALLDSDSLQRKFASFFQTRGKSIPSQVLKTNSVVLLKNILGSMDVLTVLPVDMVRDEIERGELALVDANPPAEYARAGFIMRENMHITPSMRSLIDEIRRRASQDSDDDAMAFIPVSDRPKQRAHAV